MKAPPPLELDEWEGGTHGAGSIAIAASVSDTQLAPSVDAPTLEPVVVEKNAGVIEPHPHLGNGDVTPSATLGKPLPN
jgi:hypothetical protein